MSPLVTFLLPTRGRPDRLEECVASIAETAPRSTYRIALRCDVDDEETVDRAAQLFDVNRIDCLVVGERPENYLKLSTAYTDLMPVATPWVWIWNDDVALSGQWAPSLERVATSGFIVQPDCVVNNASRYPLYEGGPFPVVPRDCLDRLGLAEFPTPIDTELDNLLRGRLGWKTMFLPGVRVRHDRHVDATLPLERY